MERFFLFGCAMVSIGLSIGYGRARYDPGAGLQSHYAILAAPLIVWFYLVWGICLKGSLAQFGQFALFTGICALFATQMMIGLYQDVVPRHERALAIRQEIREGLSPAEIAARHPDLFPNEEVLAGRLDMLREARMGPYSGLESQASGDHDAWQ